MPVFNSSAILFVTRVFTRSSAAITFLKPFWLNVLILASQLRLVEFFNLFSQNIFLICSSVIFFCHLIGSYNKVGENSMKIPTF